MPLQDLMLIAPPPQMRSQVGDDAEWSHLEGELQFQFPRDYKELIHTYGAGQFADFFGAVNPFCMSSNGPTYREWVGQRLQGIENAKRNYPHHSISFPAYPEQGGLFPWGYTDNGETLWWLMRGSNHNWPVVCTGVGCTNDYDLFDVCTSEFIAGWLTHRTVPSFTPSDFFPLSELVFVPRLSCRDIGKS